MCTSPGTTAPSKQVSHSDQPSLRGGRVCHSTRSSVAGPGETPEATQRAVSPSTRIRWLLLVAVFVRSSACLLPSTVIIWNSSLTKVLPLPCVFIFIQSFILALWTWVCITISQFLIHSSDCSNPGSFFRLASVCPFDFFFLLCPSLLSGTMRCSRLRVPWWPGD